jgi:hypothetical protein
VLVTEDVTVAVGSIDLTITVSDTVTLVESLETQTTPIQIDEFTQVILEESATVLFDLLKIDVADDVSVIESVTMQLLPVILEVYDAITVTERTQVRIGTGGRKKHDLTTVGAGE